jgi:hypothetical protein
MDDQITIQKLLSLRKVTRAVGDLLRGLLKEYLATLGPLLRPRIVLGEFIAGAPKEPTSGADKVFKDLQTAYEAVAGTRLYGLPKELKAPLEVSSSVLEFAPVEYSHTAKTERETKAVAVTAPLKWVLHYSGFGPRRLRELLTAKTRSLEELQEFVLHTLLLQAVLARQTGVVKLLEGLHFSTGTSKRPEFGELPLATVAASVATVLPPDAVIIESTEISGTDAFEEVVSLDDVLRPHDRLHGQLLEIVKQYAAALLPPQAEAKPAG